MQLKMRFFWAKQTTKETPEDHWEKLIELEKECDFAELNTELLISNFITTIVDRKLRDKLLEEKDIDVAKVVKQFQQNTYDRKNKRKTIPAAQISNSGKDTKEEPLHKTTYTRHYGTMSKERHNDQNCRYCDAPNWNLIHKCLSAL